MRLRGTLLLAIVSPLLVTFGGGVAEAVDPAHIQPCEAPRATTISLGRRAPTSSMVGVELTESSVAGGTTSCAGGKETTG